LAADHPKGLIYALNISQPGEGSSMSNTSAASDLARPLRRSTRVNKSVPITVMGVDSYRGPYREDVSTVAVSCHGCRYESKHDVLTNSWVMLELPLREKEGETVSARGLVKWVRRPQDTSGTYETAIELEDPGNIWGIDTPPQDWVTFCESRLDQAAPKSKPFAVPKPEAQAKPAVAEKPENGAGTLTPGPFTPGSLTAGSLKSTASFAPEKPAGQLANQFQTQMEKILFDAADAAVKQRASGTLDEVRQGLREEAKRVLEQVATTQTGPWIDQSLKQLNKASQETAKTLHAAWAKRLESDTRRAIERLEERSKEFDTLAQSLSANALDRLQRGLESSRGDGVDRIVDRLKEQSAPLIDRAKETMAELTRVREEFQVVLDQSLTKSMAAMEEACAGFEKQFQMMIRERLDSAREELETSLGTATSAALDHFAASAQDQQAQAESRFREALQPIAEAALSEMKEKASTSSRDFARAMSDRSRTHLELVSTSIADAAKVLSKLSGE